MPIAFALRSTAGRAACTTAAAAAIALFAGCGGSDSGDSGSASSGSGAASTPSSSGSSSSSASTTQTGAEIFDSMSCKSCHTLAASNATGVIGPNLDKAKPSADEVVEKVTNGAGSMPSFKSRLSADQIQTLADYVAKVAGT